MNVRRFVRISLVLLCGVMFLQARRAEPTIFESWDMFEKDLRDKVIDKATAGFRFEIIRERLRDTFRGVYFRGFDSWVFPVEGRRLRESSSPGGFQPQGFSFLNVKSQALHPALDIFVIDRNRDCRNDESGDPFRVFAPVDLVVLSICTEWDERSKLRGGKYIWAYHPPEDLLLYFAHFDRITVRPGQIVRAGEELGYMGRTGRNAWPPRSDTHLHFMILDISKDPVRPQNPWDRLRKR
jgi:hypothetical protein